MPIYNDKKLYFVLAAALTLMSIMAIGMAYASIGIKGVLFMAWLLFICLLFWVIIGLSIKAKGLLSNSSNLGKRAIWGYIDYHRFQITAMLLLIMFVILSYHVWQYLDKKYPTVIEPTYPVSEMPAP